MDAIELDKRCYVGTKIREHSFSSIVTSETIFPASCISDWHYHQNPHYSHILNGGSEEIRAGGIQLQSEGDGLYYYPGIPHQNILYRENTRIFNLEIEKKFFEQHHLNMPAEAQMFSDRLQINTAGLIRILKEHYWHDQHSDLAITQLSVELVADSAKVVKHYPEWATQIISLLKDTWDQNLSLTAFAAAMDIHPVTLSKCFSKYFHCTLGEYLRKIKVEKAMKMSRSGKHSLTEIAYACSFSDQAHFIKTFRRFTGMQPKQYRGL